MVCQKTNVSVSVLRFGPVFFFWEVAAKACSDRNILFFLTCPGQGRKKAYRKILFCISLLASGGNFSRTPMKFLSEVGGRTKSQSCRAKFGRAALFLLLAGFQKLNSSYYVAMTRNCLSSKKRIDNAQKLKESIRDYLYNYVRMLSLFFP